jgi:hypothetical protein
MTRMQLEQPVCAILEEFSERFGHHSRRAFEALLGTNFSTGLFQELHRRRTRWTLVERHSFPFFLMIADMASHPSAVIDYLVSALLAHTNPITHLDVYTDRSLGPRSDVSGLLDDAGYSLAALYRASERAASLEYGSTLIKECFPVSAFVAERMFLDNRERPYTVPDEDAVRDVLRDYLSSPTSRLLGCGYFEVMAKAALASNGVVADPTTIESLRRLRMLRQLTDEVIDLVEDLDAGMLTFPALLLLEEDYGNAAPIIKNFETRRDARSLQALLRHSRVPAKLYENCVELHRQGVSLWSQRWGRSATFVKLFDLRMAFLRQEAVGAASWMGRAVLPASNSALAKSERNVC